MKSITNSAFGLLIAIIIALTVQSCGTSNPLTRATAYPKMYEEKPVSILIMPPINETNKVEAKESMYATLFQPLAEKGYYVFSPFLSNELLQSESADSSEQFIDGSLNPFRNVFGADAVLFTVIRKWEKMSLLSQINVDLEYILKSTKTNEILFQRHAKLTVDTSVSSGNGLLDLLANSIATALSDHVIGARKANYFIFSDLPVGKYDKLYLNDGKTSAARQNISGVTAK